MQFPFDICFVVPKGFPILDSALTTDAVGGAEVQQCILAKELAKRGHRVSMISLDYGQDDETHIDGVRIIKAYKLNSGLPGIRFFHPRITRIWQCLRRSNAKIFYQRSASLLTGVTALFCRQYRRKFVYAVAHDTDLIPSQELLGSYRDRAAYHWGLKGAKQVLVQSIKQQNLLKQNYGKSSILIPNGYSIDQETSEPSAQATITWAATLRDWKRPELFLDLAKELPEYSFLMAGGAGSLTHDDQLYMTIKNEAEKINNLEFLGFVPYAKIDELFNRTRIFVNTSISEGFPNTFLQAWSRKIPTISFIDPVASENPSAAPNISVNDLKDMASSIRQLNTNRSLFKDRSEVCHSYFHKYHSVEGIVTKLEQTLSRL